MLYSISSTYNTVHSELVTAILLLAGQHGGTNRQLRARVRFLYARPSPLPLYILLSSLPRVSFESQRHISSLDRTLNIFLPYFVSYQEVFNIRFERIQPFESLNPILLNLQQINTLSDHFFKFEI